MLLFFATGGTHRPTGSVRAHGDPGPYRNLLEALWAQAGHYLRQEPAGGDQTPLEEDPQAY